MENFFYDDYFCSDLGDLAFRLDLDDDEDIKDLPDDWSVEVEQTNLEKIFKLTKDFVVGAILEKTDRWDDRFPENDESVDKYLRKAIAESIDIEKLNYLLPSLYYPNGKKTIITKKDLLD